MKNGINVAAISELTHEIRKVPLENEIDYAVSLQWVGGLNFRAKTQTLRFGTKRVGRDFDFDVSHVSDASPSAAPTPADYFMLGLGACVANILTQGASYKGITLDSLNVLSAAKLSSEGLHDLDVSVRIISDGSRWQYTQMILTASRFSPNYITVIMPNKIDVDYIHGNCDQVSGDLYREAMMMPKPWFMPSQSIDLGMDIAWRNGTQYDAALLPKIWNGEQRNVQGTVAVDQPVPAAGLNEAPNPQEYLLTAVAADVLQHVVLLATDQDITLRSLGARICCLLDMKGCFNIFDKAAIQLQNTQLQIDAKSDADEASMQALINKACKQSACYQAFINANKVPLERRD